MRDNKRGPVAAVVRLRSSSSNARHDLECSSDRVAARYARASTKRVVS